MDEQGQYDEDGVWTVGDVINAMTGAVYPWYIGRILNQIQKWLSSALAGESPFDQDDLLGWGSDRPVPLDQELLMNELEWVTPIVDLIPSARFVGTREEAIVLSFGPIILDEGLRMAIDHGALFARGQCKRIWVISDSWIIADIAAYKDHLKAMRDMGVDMRFMLVTPWGWTEVPWYGDEGCSSGNLIWKNNNKEEPKK